MCFAFGRTRTRSWRRFRIRSVARRRFLTAQLLRHCASRIRTTQRRKAAVNTSRGISIENLLTKDYHKTRIEDVIRKPYAVADVLARANALIAARSNEKRETVLV